MYPELAHRGFLTFRLVPRRPVQMAASQRLGRRRCGSARFALLRSGGYRRGTPV
jgi:hypothetical protein